MQIEEIYILQKNKKIPIPLFSSKIKAGFPSPADSYMEKKLDLNEYLIKHEAATFFLRVSGDSMEGAGISSNDILIVDRAEEVKDGNIIIASLNGELTVKRLKKRQGKVTLVPENPEYNEIVVTEESEFEVFGVVTFVIKEV